MNTYSDSEILPPSMAEIGWSQNYLPSENEISEQLGLLIEDSNN